MKPESSRYNVSLVKNESWIQPKSLPNGSLVCVKCLTSGLCVCVFFFPAGRHRERTGDEKIGAVWFLGQRGDLH